MERLTASAPTDSLENFVADAGKLLEKLFAESQSVHFIVAALDGTITFCNAAWSAALKVPESQAAGTSLWDYLTESDASSLRQTVKQYPQRCGQRLVLNFVDARHSPFTLNCLLDIQSTQLVLLGEVPQVKNERTNEELLGLNNELAVLMRENARKGKELAQAKAALEQALTDLQTSFWHIKKLQEVLPLCMECGKVKSGGNWEDVVQYLKQHALFLSHGYCPECHERVMSEIRMSAKD